MCHALLQDADFFRMLYRIDQDLAAQTRAGGCLFCDGVLHCANYERKPRANLAEVRDEFDMRFSFCCNRCRKRCTSMSVRFLGRRVYLGLAVVLESARHAGPIPAASRLANALAIPIRTLERWRQWWQTEFALTPLWQAQCARFMPPVATELLPNGLLERFGVEAHEALLRMLRFLTPLTVRSVIGDRCA